MAALQIFFWILFGTIFYAYVGYGVLLQLLQLFRKERLIGSTAELPAVTLLIASYNEAVVLEAKIQNALELDYPADKLSIVVVTDGSTDDSLTRLQKFPQVRVMHQPIRRGKTAAINRAMQTITTPIVVFSDANALLNTQCLRQIVRYFSIAKVGAVAGEKKVSFASGMGSAEGWYWRYESFMKSLDASFYTVVGAAGELFAMRRSLYHPPPADTILDDLVLSMQVCLQGYTIAYEPAAFATEAPSISLHHEGQRKVRIAAGAFQALRRLSFSRIFSRPCLAFQFFSRRWLRWVVCPFALPALLGLNAILAFWTDAHYYDLLFVWHLAFYLLAAVGWWLMRLDKVFPLVTIPFYFLFMNYCFIAGFFQFIQGKQSVLWAKAERLDSPISK